MTYFPDRPFVNRNLHRLIGAGFLMWAACLTGTTCGTPGGNGGSLVINAAPTGCGTKVDNTRTISWVIHFTVSGAPAGSTPLWTFDDGGSATGADVVHAFSTAARETAASTDPGANGEHAPVKFNITVTAGANSLTQSFDIPMRGTPDGGADPAGDTCVADDGRLHVPVGTHLCYTSNPPAGGPHYSQANIAPVGAGFYDEAVATERWVHNLEHGSVILLYDCGGTCSDDLKNQLMDLFNSLPPSPRFNERKMVITRYAGIEPACAGSSTFPASGPFMAIAWDVQRTFDSLDITGITDFYMRHVDHGPEDVIIPSTVTP